MDRDGVLNDERTTSGWLHPRAPGGQSPPQFEPAPEREWSAPEPDRPKFVQGRPTESNGSAVAALVLGLLGLLLLLPTAGVLSLPCSVAAWITGVQARRRIAAGITNVGEGMARAGRILGIVGVVASVVVIVAWVVLLITGFDFEELQRDLERRSDPNAVQAALVLVSGRPPHRLLP